MKDINLETVKIQQDDLLPTAVVPQTAQLMMLAIFLTDLSRIVKEKIEFLTLDVATQVSNRSIEILEDQIADHREAHRQLDKLKKHRETPDRFRETSKKV